MTETPLHPVIEAVTSRIAERSHDSRKAYLEMIRARRPDAFARTRLTAGNLAHASAGCAALDKAQLLGNGWPNIGIITAYNDMLSAHKPYEDYPELIRDAARQAGATAQIAGGVPAMCDGITQGQAGMELSLFSRDVIAMAAAIGLSHDAFDAALFLGICDKIVPGLVIAALRFGWLPAVFIPAGPMPSGLPNPEKARIRQLFAAGEVGRDELMKAEAASYHAPGTCTFYGTANSNQMLMELMGFHLPGAAFVNPGTPLRAALTKAATQQAVERIAQKETYLPCGEMIDARSIVNGIVGLMATGGSTNLTLHIPVMAAAAGYRVVVEDFAEISAVVPLLCRIYPNGPADVNHFHAAGGMGFLARELLGSGLLQGHAEGIGGRISAYTCEPWLDGDTLVWREAPLKSLDPDILRPASDPFQAEGGLRLVDGSLGRGVTKLSAVKPEHRRVRAPARVFETQQALRQAYEANELNRDFVAIVRFQGPAANGMPELHGLSPILGALQDRGHKVALVTDGRMSGASGKVAAAIHMTPEAAHGGPLARLRDGDMICLDTDTGQLEAELGTKEFSARAPAALPPEIQQTASIGRELFAAFRKNASAADAGGSLFELLEPSDNG